MMNPPVLLVTPYQRQPRGNTVTSQRLQNGLSQMGYEIDILALDSAEGWSEAEARLARHHYRILHVLHGASVEAVLQRLPAAGDLPLIITATGTDINVDLLGSQRLQIEKAFQQADRIVVFNPAFLSLLSASIPDIASKLQVIPQGVLLPDCPTWSRSAMQWNDDDVIAVLPSGIRPVKRIEWALEAMEIAAVYSPKLRLVIVGPIIDSRYAHIILRQIEHTPRTTYLGEVDHQAIGGLYAAADMVLNTSLSEGQPQAALEGMSLGLPAVMTAVTGNLDIMTNGREGYYIHTPQELGLAMLRLAEDQALRQEMGSAAARLVKEFYSASAEWEQYHLLYQELLRK
ncbi:MAG TPA: glycosyltransferase [Syntrophomonadaceae bacterium]|nr:glycosyltransferase [Syntrophomonadaceae bacterium]